MISSEPQLKECVAAIREAYGSRCEGVVLYGSCARGEETSESDVDLLVLLKGEFDTWEEIKRLTGVLLPFQVESERYISAKPVSAAKYRASGRLFYRNARAEGVMLP